MPNSNQRFFLDFDNNGAWYVLPEELRSDWLSSVETDTTELPAIFEQYRVNGDSSTVSFSMPEIIDYAA